MQKKSAKRLYAENADPKAQEKSAKQLYDTNADRQSQKKSAKQLYAQNADPKAQEKSAKQLYAQNADPPTKKYIIPQTIKTNSIQKNRRSKVCNHTVFRMEFLVIIYGRDAVMMNCPDEKWTVIEQY